MPLLGPYNCAERRDWEARRTRTALVRGSSFFFWENLQVLLLSPETGELDDRKSVRKVQRRGGAVAAFPLAFACAVRRPTDEASGRQGLTAAWARELST